MANFSAWLKTTGQANFAADLIISRDPVQIAFNRNGVERPTQRMRIVPTATGARSLLVPSTAVNVGSESLVTVIGAESLDIQKNDLFVFRGTNYKVAYVDRSMPGLTHAQARGTQ